MKLTVSLKALDREQNIVEIPNVLRVRLRRHDPLDRDRQNYPAFRMPDGSVPVLGDPVPPLRRASWLDKHDVSDPLAMLEKPDGEHEVVLNFSGTDWKLYVDDEMLDNDFPFGYPRWADR